MTGVQHRRINFTTSEALGCRVALTLLHSHCGADHEPATECSCRQGIKFSAALAARIAFLIRHLPVPSFIHNKSLPKRYCYTLHQTSGDDYWGVVDGKLEEIRETVKDPSVISQCIRSLPYPLDPCSPHLFCHSPGSLPRSFQLTNTCMVALTKQTNHSPTVHRLFAGPLAVQSS